MVGGVGITVVFQAEMERQGEGLERVWRGFGEGLERVWRGFE